MTLRRRLGHLLSPRHPSLQAGYIDLSATCFSTVHHPLQDLTRLGPSLVLTRVLGELASCVLYFPV